MKIEAPTPKALATTLGDLLGRRINAAPPPKKPPKTDFGFVASYADEAKQVVAFSFVNLAFVCHAGAALSLIPASAASDALRAGKAPDELFDNYREVANVLATVLAGAGTPIRLTSVLPLATWDAPEKKTLLERAALAQLDVEIQGYGTGKLAFVGAA